MRKKAKVRAAKLPPMDMIEEGGRGPELGLPTGPPPAMLKDKLRAAVEDFEFWVQAVQERKDGVRLAEENAAVEIRVARDTLESAQENLKRCREALFKVLP